MQGVELTVGKHPESPTPVGVRGARMLREECMLGGHGPESF